MEPTAGALTWMLKVWLAPPPASVPGSVQVSRAPGTLSGAQATGAVEVVAATPGGSWSCTTGLLIAAVPPVR